EFDCKCNNPDCTKTYIDDAALLKLESLRDLIGYPIRINSGYRCSKHQQELRDKGLQTAKGTSNHETGSAFDVSCENMTGEELATEAKRVGFSGIGTAPTWVHIDTREIITEWLYTE
ncbi:MAG: D-Ala-D-Ala carboxypeptidase family metallohydrolase, partial [Patescibacteria group bacterium]